MLVLVSFGLVLLATILLIVGLFNDTLALIYLSIAASVAAAVVLFLAFRMAKPKADKTKTPPTPIEPEESTDLAVSDASQSQAAVDDDAEVIADDVTAVQPAVAAGSSDDDWMEDEDWDDAVVDFPIADYDDLTVAEVMPLLPQLYSDELDTVIERERAGKNRSTIINRLQELKVSGTAADMEDLGDDAAPQTRAGSNEVDGGQDGPGAASVPLVDLGDDEDEDDWFPIADYDTLSVAQVVPLLDQLEPDELEDVRSRESGGSGRKTILAEIDRLLSGDGAAPEPAPATASSRGGAGSRFPIANYDELTVADIRPRLSDLSDSQLQKVLDHERSTSGRTSIIGEIERRLGAATAPVRKAAARSARATKKAAKSARARFPIANYDDLTVSDIRPRLADLSERQLEQVRERELAGAARKTILKEIESRLP